MTTYTGTAGNDIWTINTQSQLVAGDVYDGAGGINELVFGGNNSTTFDLGAITLTNIQILDSGYATVLITAAQFAAVTTLLGSFTTKTGGSYSFSGKTLGTNSGSCIISMGGTGGTLDFTGDIVNPGVAVNIFGSRNGPTTIIGGTGQELYNSFGKGDTIHGGSGNDVIQVYAGGNLAGNTYIGGSGITVLNFINNSGPPVLLSSATIANIQGLMTGLGEEVDLSSSQLQSFQAVGGGTFRLMDAGNVTLSGNAAILGPYGASGTFILADAGQTFDIRGETGNTLTVQGGAGNDTIFAPTFGSAAIYGGGGNDAIWAGLGGGSYDNIDGGSGVNTLHFDTIETNIAIKEQPGGLYITGAGGSVESAANIQILAFADATIDLRATVQSFSGGGNQLLLGTGQTYNLSATGGVADVVAGSSGTVNLAGAQASVFGDHDVVNLNGNGNTVAVSGASDTDNAGGTGNVITIGGNGAGAATADVVALAQGGTVTVADNARVDIYGNGAAVTLGSNDVIGLVGNRTTLAVAGSGDQVWIGGNGAGAALADVVTLAQAATLHETDNGRIDVFGGGATVITGNNDTLGVYGGAAAVFLNGTGDQLWVGGNGAAAAVTDNVFVAHAAMIHEVDNSRIDVIGNGATVVTGANDTLGLFGGAGSVYASGGWASIWIGGNGASAAVADSVFLTHGGAIHEQDNSRIDILGDNAAVALGANETLGVFGQNDSLTFGASIGHTGIWGANTSDHFTLSKSSFVGAGAGFDYWAYLLGHSTVTGGNTTITLDGSDTITLAGFALSAANQSQFSFV